MKLESKKKSAPLYRRKIQILFEGKYSISLFLQIVQQVAGEPKFSQSKL